MFAIHLVIFFATGLVLAMISTLGVRFISHGQSVFAGSLSFISSVVGMGAVVQILQDIHLYGYGGIVAYSAGFGIGTMLTVKYHMIGKKGA